jgi:hypothetical protein
MYPSCRLFLTFALAMDQKEQQFLSDALSVFMKFGIKSVTMDDLARHLGMSKKTIYTFVKDKSDLIEKGLNLNHGQECQMMDGICSKGLNAIDEMFEIGHFVSGMLTDLHPSIHYDLEKYHATAFHTMREKHEVSIYECISANLSKGVKEGLYRKDLNIDVIAKLYTKRVDNVYDAELFPPNEIAFSEVYAIMFRYHILGVASPKGAAYLDKKWKKIKTNKL